VRLKVGPAVLLAFHLVRDETLSPQRDEKARPLLLQRRILSVIPDQWHEVDKSQTCVRSLLSIWSPWTTV